MLLENQVFYQLSQVSSPEADYWKINRGGFGPVRLTKGALITEAEWVWATRHLKAKGRVEARRVPDPNGSGHYLQKAITCYRTGSGKTKPEGLGL